MTYLDELKKRHLPNFGSLQNESFALVFFCGSSRRLFLSMAFF